MRWLWKLSALVLLVSSCATPEHRHALIDQILVPVASQKPLLCNRAFDPKTQKYELSCQDLRDENARFILWRLKFICKVGKEMWAVDLEKPGLVRNTTKKKKRFLRSDEIIVKEDYRSLEAHYDFFVSANTRCFSQQTYAFDLM